MSASASNKDSGQMLLLKQFSKMLKELKPTQKSIHESSSWFLKVTSGHKQKANDHLLASMAQYWKKFYDHSM